MEDYKPNSHKSKAEQAEGKKIEKVVTGTVKTKKNEVRKFRDIFISEDVGNVKSYIFMDVLVPAIKKAVFDIVTDGIDMFLYGGTGHGKKSSVSSTKVSYRDYYDKKDNYRERDSRNRSGFDYDDLVFRSRGEAEAVREQMIDVIDRYGFVTVADLYDMADLTAPYTSNKYGWTNLRNAEVVHVRDGYMVKLPRATIIE